MNKSQTGRVLGKIKIARLFGGNKVLPHDTEITEGGEVFELATEGTVEPVLEPETITEPLLPSDVVDEVKRKASPNPPLIAFEIERKEISKTKKLTFEITRSLNNLLNKARAYASGTVDADPSMLTLGLGLAKKAAGMIPVGGGAVKAGIGVAQSFSAKHDKNLAIAEANNFLLIFGDRAPNDEIFSNLSRKFAENVAPLYTQALETISLKPKTEVGKALRKFFLKKEPEEGQELKSMMSEIGESISRQFFDFVSGNLELQDFLEEMRNTEYPELDDSTTGIPLTEEQKSYFKSELAPGGLMSDGSLGIGDNFIFQKLLEMSLNNFRTSIETPINSKIKTAFELASIFSEAVDLRALASGLNLLDAVEPDTATSSRVPSVAAPHSVTTDSKTVATADSGLPGRGPRPFATQRRSPSAMDRIIAGAMGGETTATTEVTSEGGARDGMPLPPNTPPPSYTRGRRLGIGVEAVRLDRNRGIEIT